MDSYLSSTLVLLVTDWMVTDFRVSSAQSADLGHSHVLLNSYSYTHKPLLPEVNLMVRTVLAPGLQLPVMDPMDSDQLTSFCIFLTVPLLSNQ